MARDLFKVRTTRYESRDFVIWMRGLVIFWLSLLNFAVDYFYDDSDAN